MMNRNPPDPVLSSSPSLPPPAPKRQPFELPLEAKLRAQVVTRWHTVPHSIEQTVASHTFGYMQIGLWLIKNGRLEKDVDVGRWLQEALDHDIDEVVTGDKPSLLSIETDENMSIHRWLGKASDLLEAWWFITNFGVGPHSTQIQKRYIEKMNYWFGLKDKRVLLAQAQVALMERPYDASDYARANPCASRGHAHAHGHGHAHGDSGAG